MKPNRLRATLVLLALLLAPARSSHPENEVPHPEPGEIAGVWVGFDQDFLHFYRVELDKQGKGVCVSSFVDKPPLLYDVRKWTLDGFNISFDLEPIDNEAEPIALKGQAGRNVMLLEVGSEVTKWKRKLSLVREEDFITKNQKAKERVRAFVELPKGKR
jgi:hypothetical protein